MWLLSVINEKDHEYVYQIFCDTKREAEDELNGVLDEWTSKGYNRQNLSWYIAERKPFPQMYMKMKVS